MLLDELTAEARRRAADLSSAQVRPCGRADFAAALRGRGRLSVIAEFKRSSPSEGGIAPEADLESQLACYQAAGAAAVSVLTEPSRFGGSPDDLVRAAACSSLPLLMKDFVVDPRQVLQACTLGASACLLIVRCLEPGQLHELAAACREQRMVPLLECHTAAEVERALEVDDAVLGVNNRDLDTLEIHLERAPELLAEVPEDRVVVAESGYTSAAQAIAVRGRVDAVLIGTALMRAEDPGAFVAEVGA